MSVRSQLTTRHVAPASSERQSDPWFAVCMSAYTRFGSDAATATSTLPMPLFGRPGCTIFVHLVPPSRVTYTPLPGPPLNIAHVCITTSHVPAYSTFGSLASIVRPEQPVFGFTNSTRSHVVPPSF